MTTQGALCVLGPYDGRWHVGKSEQTWFGVWEHRDPPLLTSIHPVKFSEPRRPDVTYVRVRIGSEAGPFVWAPLGTPHADVLTALTKHYPADPGDQTLRQHTTDLARAIQNAEGTAPVYITENVFNLLREAIHAAEQRGRAARSGREGPFVNPFDISDVPPGGMAVQITSPGHGGALTRRIVISAELAADRIAFAAMLAGYARRFKDELDAGPPAALKAHGDPA